MLTLGKNTVNLREIFGLVFSFGLGFAFLYIAFRGISMKDFLASLSRVSIWWMLMYTAFSTFSHYLRAIRWKYLLSILKQDISVHHIFASIMIGYGFNNIIPRLGEVSRAVFLGRYEKISRVSILGTIVVERVLDIIMFGSAVIISGMIYAKNLDDTFVWLKFTLILGAIVIVASIIFLVLLVKQEKKIVRLVQKLFSRSSEKTSLKIKILLEKLISGFHCFQSASDTLLTIIFSVLIMINYGLNTYLGFYMLGMQNERSIDFGMAWVTMSISAIGVMIPTPGGLGSYHSITKSVLQKLYAFGETISISYAFLSHAITYVLNTLFAVAYIILFRKKFGDIDINLMLKPEQESE